MASTPAWPQQALSGLKLGSDPDHDLCLRPGRALLKCEQRPGPHTATPVLLEALHPSQPSQSLLRLNPAGPPLPHCGGALATTPPAASLVLVRRVKVPPDRSLQWEGLSNKLYSGFI